MGRTKILSAFVVPALIAVTGCTGPVGAQGPPTPTGAANLPDGSVLQGLVIQHDAADDAANRTGIVHLRVRSALIAGRIVAANDDIDISRNGLGGLDSGSPAMADTWYAVLLL